MVSTADLKFDGVLRRGSSVTMLWNDGEWKGTIIDMEESPPNFDTETDDDDEIPLLQYLSSKLNGELIKS